MMYNVAVDITELTLQFQPNTHATTQIRVQLTLTYCQWRCCRLVQKGMVGVIMVMLLEFLILCF
jgi:hypothetical protein